jgi:hypothetical protein
VGPKASGLTYKSRAKCKMLRRIYSAIYGEVNVPVSGGYMLQYAGGTGASSCFIYVTSKSGQAGNIWTYPCKPKSFLLPSSILKKMVRTKRRLFYTRLHGVTPDSN